MGDKTAIAWVRNPDGSQGATWNPAVGCSPVSPACAKCYAARLASTRLSKVPAYAGLAENGKWKGIARLLPERLDEPWRWRKPRGIFLCDMGDIFHPSIPDDYIARCFAVMQAAHWHTFYVLTKNSERLAHFTNTWSGARCARVLAEQGPVLRGAESLLTGDQDLPWPPRNVVGGVTAENYKHLVLRSSGLLRAKLAMRFISCEPMLGGDIGFAQDREWLTPFHDVDASLNRSARIDWVIIGGENDVDARDFDVDAAERLIEECQEAGTPVFLKQLGTRPVTRKLEGWAKHIEMQGDGFGNYRPVGMRHRAGADPGEWPERLRVREMHPALARS